MSLDFQTHEQCSHLTGVIAATSLGSADRRAKRYASGTIIWGVGSLPDFVFRLQRGRVDIVSLDEDGNELLLRAVRPGETFGEVCFCGHRNEPHGIIARCAGPCEVAQLTYDDFRQSLRKDGDLMETVLAEFCSRLGDLERRAQILALHDASERLARLLVYVAQTRGVKAKNGRDFTVTMGHAELAALGALSRPHVSLLMTQFRDRGWVSYQRGTALTIHTGKIQST